MSRTACPVLSACLLVSIGATIPLRAPATTLSCGPPPVGEAVVGLGLSAIDEDLHVTVYEGEEGGFCTAWLLLKLSALPSRSLAPRPRELAAELTAVARSFGAELCDIAVEIEDDTPAEDVEDERDLCWHGLYRYDGDFWRTEVEDATCW